MPDTLWTVTELAAYLGYSKATVVTFLSRSPERLPPRVAVLDRPRWVEQVVHEWALNQSRPRNKGGRPRKISPAS